MGQEKNFENRVKDFLKKSGCWFVKYWGGGEFTKSGIPDILVCCHGYFIGLEVKSKTGKPSGLQIKNIRDIHQCGGFGILLYPQDFHRFRSLIGNLQAGDDVGAMGDYQYFQRVWHPWLTKYRMEGVIA